MKKKLKNAVAIGCASLEILLGASAVKAMDGQIKFGKKEPTEQVEKGNSKYDLSDLLTLGAALGVEHIIHEAGHYLGAKAVGENITFNDYSNWKFKGNPSSGDKNITYLSGFGLPMLVSEIALDNPKISKDSTFNKSLIAAPFLYNLGYVIKDAIGSGREGNDFEGMEKNGLGREITYPLLLAIPAIQAWRALKNKKNNENKKSLTSKTEYFAAPTNGGAMLGFTHKF